MNQAAKVWGSYLEYWLNLGVLGWRVTNHKWWYEANSPTFQHFAILTFSIVDAVAIRTQFLSAAVKLLLLSLCDFICFLYQSVNRRSQGAVPCDEKAILTSRETMHWASQLTRYLLTTTSAHHVLRSQLDFMLMIKQQWGNVIQTSNAHISQMLCDFVHSLLITYLLLQTQIYIPTHTASLPPPLLNQKWKELVGYAKLMMKIKPGFTCRKFLLQRYSGYMVRNYYFFSTGFYSSLRTLAFLNGTSRSTDIW
jgi:hypothetical protein